MDRKILLRLSLAALALAIIVPALAGFATGLVVPVWDSGTNRYTWPQLGPSLLIRNNQLDVLLPPGKVRVYDALLTYDGAKGGWPLPTGAVNVVLYSNGLRNHQGTTGDFTIVDGVAKPNPLFMLPEHLITADYDLPEGK